MTYDVTYFANGADSGSTPASQAKTRGTSLTLAANPGGLARTGYTFTDWNTEADGSGTMHAAGATYTSDMALALFATWAVAMVEIPAGTFDNGTSKVTLSAFRMSTYDITQGQYQAIMGTNPSRFSEDFEAANCPVEQVTWYDAVEFCNKLSTTVGLTPVYTITNRIPATGYPMTWAMVSATLTGNGYRLPTEAQWEYASRAGTETTYYWGDDGSAETVGRYAWYGPNSGCTTHVVGQKLPNAFGLYDMAGNVWQWCWDWYGAYPAGAQTDPTGPALGIANVLRGGGWRDSGSSCPVGSRFIYNPYSWYDSIGFRIVAPW